MEARNNLVNYNIIVSAHNLIIATGKINAAFYAHGRRPCLSLYTVFLQGSTGRYKTRNVEWNGTAEWNAKRQKKPEGHLFSLNHSLEVTSISIGRVAQRSLVCILQCSPQRLTVTRAVAHVPLAQAHRADY